MTSMRTIEEQKLDETEILSKLAERSGLTLFQARRLLVELFRLDKEETEALLVDAQQECIRRLNERLRRGR